MVKKIIKQILPERVARFIQAYKNKHKSTEAIFTEIYEKKLWGTADDGRKYCSGAGTVDENASQYISVLQDFIQKKDIQHVFEIGCGDFSIMSSVLAPFENLKYTGADIVKNVVTHLNSTYANEQIQFIHMNAIENTEYPTADLCVIRQVLQHLSNQQIMDILQKLKPYKYVIITEHIPLHPQIKNGDKSANGYIRLQNRQTSGIFLDAPPFSLYCQPLLSYPYNDVDYHKQTVAGLMLTQLVEI